MDPYEALNLRPRNRNWFLRCVNFLFPNMYFVNPWASTPKYVTYPESLSSEEALQLLAEQEKKQDARDAEWIPVTVTVLDDESAPQRTLMEIKRSNRALKHQRQANRSWR